MALHRQERWRETMAPEVLPPIAKRRRLAAPAFHHHVPSFPANFQYEKIPATMPVPTMATKPVSFPPMQGQGFIVKNPNPGLDMVRLPRMVKPVLVQGFQPQQYGQGFFPSQHHQQVQVQGFAVQNPSVGVFTSPTVNRVDQVSGLNQHQAPTSSLLMVYANSGSAVPGTRPVAPMSAHQVRLDQLLSSSVLSELIQSIKAQGLLSQVPEEETLVEDDVPLEFDAAWLKVRHESVIKSLYSDIPRQCRTCGRRFKTQEEHSKHMDWHVKKNREIKKMKTVKVKSSQPWFFPQSMCLNKATEVLTETSYGGPLSFFRQDSTLEMKKDEEFSVPVDEDQKLCALCREAFEDFYSDETEDWMYKGAVYMKARNGSMASGKDRTKLGPIVHAKCLPEIKQL